MLGALLLTSLLSFSSAAVLAPRNATACNNSPDLCSRSYSDITHLGAHDSSFVRDSSTDYSTSGNQFFNASVQLSAGVRLLTSQVHNNKGEWHLCHTSCDLLDAGKLSDWLSAIKFWMDNNPKDVVTILLVNSDNASAGDLDAQFVAADIKSLAYTPPSTTSPPTTWPTLQNLISNNTRLMTFIASLDPSSNTVAPYLMDEFTFIWENPYDVARPSNFSCQPDRPSSVQGDTSAAVNSRRMAFMNHFLETDGAFGIQTPDVGNITTTNAPSGGVGNLGTAASNCKTQYGKAPTFILVDFFDQGPAISTVDTLNNISPVGRTTPPPTNSAATSAGSRGKNNMFKGLVDLTASVRNGAKPTIGNWIWVGGDWGSALGGVTL